MELRNCVVRSLPCFVMLVLFLPTALRGATVIVINGDDPGEGLNDPTALVPAGGNPASTVGEARQRAVSYAAALLGASLESEVPIRVNVRFDSLGGDETSAALGTGGAVAAYRDFAGAPVAGTWYPSALADKLAGEDLGGAAMPDVDVVLNADVDGGVALGSSRFYYGFDARPEPGDIDLVAVAVHEMSHGLGMTTFIDRSTGSKLNGFDDAFMRFLEHAGASPADFPSMDDGQRLAAITGGDAVHWVGSAATALAGGLTSGVAADGHLQMYAPDPASGSSLDHFSTTLAPDHFLEPFYVTPEVELGLVLGVFEDLGWGVSPACTAGSLP